jgi:hypothetical protein
MDPGRPDAGMQEAIDALPDAVRMDAIALVACRSMKTGDQPSAEDRIANLRRAASDLRTDPSAATRCMRTLNARTTPPATRRP